MRTGTPAAAFPPHLGCRSGPTLRPSGGNQLTGCVPKDWGYVMYRGGLGVMRAPEGDPEHTQTLANLTTRITTAATSDAHATTRIANVSGLQANYRSMGAYGDITPWDGETTTLRPRGSPT